MATGHWAPAATLDLEPETATWQKLMKMEVKKDLGAVGYTSCA